jgi:hypothetical protein
MSLMQSFGTGTGYLKAGFLGFPKSGKTWTAMLLACGVRERLGLTAPIAIFDTEGGGEYVAHEIQKRTGAQPIGIRSRKFDDLLSVAKECESGAASVLIVDSITHVWRELCDAYLKQLNERRAKKGQSQQLRLEFQDWNTIKPKWATWTDFYLNSRLHVVICGRAGYEYDFEERDDDSGKKDLIKTGVKMKTESEFGFEPSLLVQMERVQSMERSKAKNIVHRATVLGDRFDAIDGAECDDPNYAFFAPHVDRLVPGEHAPIDTATGTDFGLDVDGDDTFNRERKLRVILAEKVQAALTERWPGQTKEDKQKKIAALKQAFGTTSWTEVETKLDSAALTRGLAEIENMQATPASEVA